MLKMLLVIVVSLGLALCLFWGMRYVGRQLGWPDSVSVAVVGMTALIVLFAERARVRKGAP
jgi:hypothetical protein